MKARSAASLAQKVTVVVVPRERLTTTPRAVASVIASIPPAVPLIVVDGAYPPDVRRDLKALSRRRPFVALRFDHFLLPAEARNRALDIVRTPYLVFVDNDIEVETGWLEPLVAAAEARKAAAVTPLTTIRIDRGAGSKEYVHHAGGFVFYMEYKGGLTYTSRRRHEWASPDDPVLDALSAVSDDIEMHTFLVDAAALRAIGGFDERLVICDHDDVALRLQMAGGPIVFCRKAKACYTATGTIDRQDQAYFAFRWSRARVALSCATFKRNWIVCQRFSWEWAIKHRRRMLAPFAPALFRKLPAALFDIHVAGLRLKNRWSSTERGRGSLGPSRTCPAVPPAVARFYVAKLTGREPESAFPRLPTDLAETAAPELSRFRAQRVMAAE